MLLIDNIGTMATMVDDGFGTLGIIHDAAIIIEKDKIVWCGKKSQLPQQKILDIIDAQGCLVIPGLIDCHTHLLFAGSRADEFARRMNNESYQAIMEKGKGIFSTVDAVHKATDENLLFLALTRLDAMLSRGVTTIEAKSGYGLTSEQELRALGLLKQLNGDHAIDIHATFLGAHAMPSEFKNNRKEYINQILSMLEHIKKEDLAHDCDVFCEAGAFTVEEAHTILSQANMLGFGLRAHVQQLGFSGGIGLLKDLPIKSISHADFISEHDFLLIAQSGAVVEALPFAALFLRSAAITPVEQLINHHVKLAIATDFNPGSAMCDDLVLAARLGVTYFRFSLEHALCAITSHAAQSLGRSDRGMIKAGMKADVVITNCADINEFFYDWTKHPTQIVIKNGIQVSG